MLGYHHKTKTKLPEVNEATKILGERRGGRLSSQYAVVVKQKSITVLITV